MKRDTIRNYGENFTQKNIRSKRLGEILARKNENQREY